MSEFNDGGASSSAGYPYTVLASQYSPATTVAISLRQFEKEAKTQAEREYDADHGPLPEPPAEDDTSLPPASVQRLKKKRKVRSAIVSRRKSAIYLEKLEAELEYKDSVNAQMKTRLGVFQDVLRETEERIHALKRAFADAAAGHTVAKRRRVDGGAAGLQGAHSTGQHAGGTHPEGGAFFLDDTIDDLLSISADEMGALQGYAKGVAIAEGEDRRSGQSSPVTPRLGRMEGGHGQTVQKEFPRICLTDSVWRPAGVAGGLGFRDARVL